MESFKKKEIEQNRYRRDWKEKNPDYLKELEKFLDIVDNVTNERLKLDIIYQMLKCDEILTKIAEQEIKSEV